MKLTEKRGGGEVITLTQWVSFKTLAFFEQVTHPSVHRKKKVKFWPKSDPTCQAANFGTAFGKSGTSRENPCTSRENPCTSRKVPKIDQKQPKKKQKSACLSIFTTFPFSSTLPCTAPPPTSSRFKPATGWAN